MLKNNLSFKRILSVGMKISIAVYSRSSPGPRRQK